VVADNRGSSGFGWLSRIFAGEENPDRTAFIATDETLGLMFVASRAARSVAAAKSYTVKPVSECLGNPPRK